jgi:hypothetical protein
MAGPQAVTTVQQLFEADLAGGSYAAGEMRGYWRLLALDWPFAFFEITAASRAGAPDFYVLRVDASQHPNAPTAVFWDMDASTPLAAHLWPGGTDRIARAFNPGWNPNALYVPMDRVALAGHFDWPAKYAPYMWDAQRDISQYLRLVYDLLHDDAYTGLRGA